jgi:hypothetical protein
MELEARPGGPLMLRSWLIICLQVSLALWAGAQGDDSGAGEIIPSPQLVIDSVFGPISIPFSCINKDKVTLRIIDVQDVLPGRLVLGRGPTTDGGTALEINAATIAALQPWTPMFDLLYECELYIHDDAVNPNDKDSLGQAQAMADRNAIRWIRDNIMFIPELIRDSECSNLTGEERAECAADEISNAIVLGSVDPNGEVPTERAEFVATCFKTNNDTCTPPPPAQPTEAQEAPEPPDVTDVRTDDEVKHAEEVMQQFVASDDAAYRRRKHDLGLDTSSSSIFAPRIVRVQAQTSNTDRQLAFLNQTLTRLMQQSEAAALPGIAAYVAQRIQIAKSLPKQAPDVYVAAWVREVDSVFSKMHDVSHNLAVRLSVDSQPTDGAHFVMKAKTGFVEIDTITNSVKRNAYRGIYQYTVTAQDMQDGGGAIDLIDAVGTKITCHLQAAQQSICEAQ